MTEESSADVTIVPADNNDTQSLVELWIDLAADQRHHGSHLVAEGNRSAIHETILQHVVTGTALVARREETIVGFVTFDVESGRYRQDVSRGIVHNIYVRESDQREGVGHRLLTAAEAELGAKGVDVVSLQAMAANDEAIQFYRRHGYEPHRIELEKPINSDSLK